MGFLPILLLAFAQAMDAVAVAATAGMATRDLKLRHVISAAVVFGGFQGAMPVAGWLLGSLLGPKVQAYDHWIAFGILTVLGLRALKEALGADDDAACPDAFAARRLLLLGVATSIDAFAVGITLPMIGAPLVLSCVTIGVVTALSCALAVVVGNRAGALFGKRMEVIGGVALVAIGVWILVDHLRVT